MTTKTIITDPALVPQSIVEKDKALQAQIELATSELDCLRWESTMCPFLEKETSFKAYGDAVGLKDNGRRVRESAKAWAAHGLGCTNPEHGGKEMTPEQAPDAEAHGRARLRARNDDVKAAAIEAVAKASPTPVKSVTVERTRRPQVAEVIEIASAKAREAEVEVPDEAMIDAAAREVAKKEGDDLFLRQRVKKAMMANRGIIDFKQLDNAEVEALLKEAEDLASKPHPSTGAKVEFEDALRTVFERDERRVRHSKAEAEKDKRQKLLVFEFGRLLINVNLKLHQAAKLLKEIEVKGVSPDQKDRIEANVGRARDLLNLLEASVVSMEAIDWDEALADLMEGVEDE